MTLVAFDWANALTTAVPSIVLGLGGFVATYKTGNRQQDTALEVTRQQADAQVAVAREERQQKRLEGAYAELLTALTVMTYWVPTVYPPMTSTPEQFTMPPMPELPDSAKKETLWTAYWSPRVKQLMKDWETCVRKVQHSAMLIGFSRAEALRSRDGHTLSTLRVPGHNAVICV